MVRQFSHESPSFVIVVPMADETIPTVERPSYSLEPTDASHRDDPLLLAEVTDFVAQGLLTEHKALLTLTGRSLAGKEAAR